MTKNTVKELSTYIQDNTRLVFTDLKPECYVGVSYINEEHVKVDSEVPKTKLHEVVDGLSSSLKGKLDFNLIEEEETEEEEINRKNQGKQKQYFYISFYNKETREMIFEIRCTKQKILGAADEFFHVLLKLYKRNPEYEQEEKKEEKKEVKIVEIAKKSDKSELERLVKTKSKIEHHLSVFKKHVDESSKDVENEEMLNQIIKNIEKATTTLKLIDEQIEKEKQLLEQRQKENELLEQQRKQQQKEQEREQKNKKILLEIGEFEELINMSVSASTSWAGVVSKD